MMHRLPLDGREGQSDLGELPTWPIADVDGGSGKRSALNHCLQCAGSDA